MAIKSGHSLEEIENGCGRFSQICWKDHFNAYRSLKKDDEYHKKASAKPRLIIISIDCFEPDHITLY
ncbi:hypothetical protein BEI67_03530 [Photobacterium damselae subsp. piscicida]|uniref:Uncharacterized protein n=1 Tax=Aliarcobacter cryaerophilus TaxID=28198 RepID=A0A2S9SJR5_9BACT|nr:hypothetical protein A0J46_18355 [Photobacterium damselae subsp. damselae]OLQ82387.1 hypothetical protein BEI67_03530 [Photobacterium damselae subsp. piscicida]PRM86828.1 hypothetical protein CJ671_10870 [Aliarcobacter cryaerophilus]PSV78582.1 hypothetical protein CTT35_04540 [Photobacterium damselae]PSW82707.1 hypothetical protein CTT37_04500 [Photobacterium damselae]